MGLFSNLFGKKDNEKEKAVFYAEQDLKMKEATKKAQENFKYFWREVYWEYRRIIPAHDFAMVKIPFEQNIGGQSVVEHMWVNNIDFDGENIFGELVNAPHQLTNIAKGDSVSRKVNEISDWMFSILGKTYGGFTIQAMRAGMSAGERQNHDNAWRLDFGDYNEVLVAYKQKEEPENLIEHPMSKNMAEKLEEFLKDYPEELTHENENGLTILHQEAIAGNKMSIDILLAAGMDKTKKAHNGKTALDYAKLMGWGHLVEVLG